MPKPRPEIIAGVLITLTVGPLLLPPSLTRLLPLVGSIVTLQWDMDEYYFLSAWLRLQPSQRPPLSSPQAASSSDAADTSSLSLSLTQLNSALRRWYTAWFQSPGAFPAAISIPITWSSTAITLYRLYKTQALSYPIAGLYLAGLGLAIAHIPFGGKVFGLLDTVKEGKSAVRDQGAEQEGEGKAQEMDSVEALRRWLNMHGWRCATIDLPAAVCFVVATALAL